VPKKKITRNRRKTTLAIVKKEMAKPRIATSIQEAEVNLAISRLAPVNQG